MAKLLAVANRQLVDNIAAEDVFLIPVARTPVGARIIGVLPARLPARASGLGAAPSRTEIARRVAQALGVSVGHLPLQTIAHALLQDSLQRVILLIRVGHVGSSNRVHSAWRVTSDGWWLRRATGRVEEAIVGQVE